MTESSRLLGRLGGGELPSVAQKGPRNVHPAAGEGDEGLDVVAALSALLEVSAIGWSMPGSARGRAALLTAAHRDHEIVRNPHLTEDWAEFAVRFLNLLAAVQAVLGPDVAVENTFLVVKWPYHSFEIP